MWHFFVLATFLTSCDWDLSLNRCTEAWNLFENKNMKKWASAASLSTIFHYPDLFIHKMLTYWFTFDPCFFQRSCFQGGILVWAQCEEEKNPNFFSLQNMLLKIWVLLLGYLHQLPVCVAIVFFIIDAIDSECFNQLIRESPDWEISDQSFFFC